MINGLIPLLRLIFDAGAVSPKAPPRPFGTRPRKTDVTPPSSKSGVRPNCGLGSKAVLVNDEWVCVPDFK